MSMALAEGGGERTRPTEDKINRIMEARKMLPNASYFAFTATPKNKTLEMFGEPYRRRRGQGQAPPFHSYTMKQAIQEGFILDVLKNYTPVDSYYKLVKKIEDDPEFDTKKAQKKLRRYVESHDHAIRLKAEIMVDHFHEQVLGAEQDRRPGAGDGGDTAASSGPSSISTPSATISRSARARTGHRRLLRRARVRRRQGHRGVAQRLPSNDIADKIRKTRTAS
jgi:type I restriction enzyme R subunit